MTTYIHLHFSIFVALIAVAAINGAVGCLMGNRYQRNKATTKSVFVIIFMLALLSPFFMMFFL